jgi:uncharacterized membrane protein
MLAQYSQIFPGCAERIVAMAERQAEHRRHLERTVVESVIAASKEYIGLAVIIADAMALAGFFICARRT